MLKIKKKNPHYLIQYQHLLKNNFLNEKQFKKNNVYENIFLLKRPDFNVIELNPSKQLLLPFTLTHYNNISTLQQEFNKQLLFDYTLNKVLLRRFCKIIFPILFQKNNGILRLPILCQTHKYKKYYVRFYVNLFGFLIRLHVIHFHPILYKLFTNKFVKIRVPKGGGRVTRLYKVEQGKKFFTSIFYGKLLNFKIVFDNFRKSNCFSHRKYIADVKKRRKKKKIYPNIYKAQKQEQKLKKRLRLFVKILYLRKKINMIYKQNHLVQLKLEREACLLAYLKAKKRRRNKKRKLRIKKRKQAEQEKHNKSRSVLPKHTEEKKKKKKKKNSSFPVKSKENLSNQKKIKSFSSRKPK